MKQLLITGFDPFGGECVNPSWEAVSRLPDAVGPWRLTKLQIPTVFGLAAQTVLATAGEGMDAIVCVGQAGGRDAVTVERIAINMASATIADNHGSMPKEEPVIPGGPDGIFATVDVAAMVRAVCDAGLPGKISNTAGTFVCNDTLYRLLHRFAGSGTRVGFIHVPHLPDQAGEGKPSMELADIIAALTAAIGAIG